MIKKILHITPYYKPASIYGGPIISVSRLCESQSSLGLEVTVFTTNANGEQTEDFEPHTTNLNGVATYYFKRYTGNSTFLTPKLLATLWKRVHSYDVIHIHTWWNLVAVFSVLICWLKGVRPILSTRGMVSAYSFQSGNKTMKKIMHHTIGKWLLKKTILHVTVQQEADECLSVYPQWPHFIAPNLVDFS